MTEFLFINNLLEKVQEEQFCVEIKPTEKSDDHLEQVVIKGVLVYEGKTSLLLHELNQTPWVEFQLSP